MAHVTHLAPVTRVSHIAPFASLSTVKHIDPDMHSIPSMVPISSIAPYGAMSSVASYSSISPYTSMSHVKHIEPHVSNVVPISSIASYAPYASMPSVIPFEQVQTLVKPFPIYFKDDQLGPTFVVEQHPALRSSFWPSDAFPYPKHSTITYHNHPGERFQSYIRIILHGLTFISIFSFIYCNNPSHTFHLFNQIMFITFRPCSNIIQYSLKRGHHMHLGHMEERVIGPHQM